MSFRPRSPPAALALALALVLPAVACAPATPTRPTAYPTAAAAAPAGPTTVYVVRHGERVSDEDRDSPLSEAGQSRAEALASALEAAGISAVYSTPYRRTRDTAAPLATRLGVEIVEREAGGGEDAARALARAILERHAGEAVLVVGHSNTVSLIVHALGGPALEELPTSRYGDLFIVTIPREGPVRSVRARFGT
jgi:broad specificity phosphatase PhoE